MTSDRGVAVQQAWWGLPIKKGTWLCFSNVPKESVDIPFALRYGNGDRQVWNTMSKHQRSATCLDFAQWLINVASNATRGSR